MPLTSAPARCYQVAGRTPGSGPVVAVLTDGPTDLTVAATAAAWAAETRTLLIAAAAVGDTGFSVNALLHRTRTGRTTAESAAIVGRVVPILTATGVAWLRTAVAVPAGADASRTLPLGPVLHLTERFGAVAVVTAAALHDPSGRLTPVPRDAALATPPPRRLRSHH